VNQWNPTKDFKCSHWWQIKWWFTLSCSIVCIGVTEQHAASSSVLSTIFVRTQQITLLRNRTTQPPPLWFENNEVSLPHVGDHVFDILAT